MIAEALLAAAAFCAVFSISLVHIIDRRAVTIADMVTDFDMKTVVADSKKAIDNAMESVVKKTDETVWTTDSVNYRVGPGEKYETVGTLGAYSGVHRSGETLNKWSLVTVGDENYYVLSEYVTTEEPIIKETGAKGEYQRYALSLLDDYGWDVSEIYPLIKLWNRESGWNPNAHNRRSGAHGIPQALPASKMASEGSDYYTNGNTQIRWGLGYIKSRYGSPSRAWNNLASRGWY